MKEEETLDNILMWEHFERPRYIKKIKRQFILLMIISLGFVLMLVFPHLRESFVPMVTLALLGFLFCLWIYKINDWAKKDNSYRKFLLRKADEIPIEKINLALKQEKNYWIAILWAVECHEAHIPGDCPLCGAE